MENPSFEQIVDCIKLDGFLTTDGNGEGIVIKNYDYYNSHGCQVWAKIVTSEFLNLKENNAKSRNALNVGNLEGAIVEKYLTNAFIEKEYSKIVHENPEIQRKQLIPKLFEFIWNEFLTEEIVNIIYDFKMPSIDFKILHYLMIIKIKEVKKELFLK